jgi:hypothetical protein
MTRFAERMAALDTGRRLHFYEVFAHQLTVAIRGVWSDGSITDAEKVDRVRWVNEILHRATAKVWVLRLNTHEWTEEDFGSLVAGYVADCPGIAAEVRAALDRSYRAVAGEDMA